jgi:hypothetical protein
MAYTLESSICSNSHVTVLAGRGASSLIPAYVLNFLIADLTDKLIWINNKLPSCYEPCFGKNQISLFLARNTCLTYRIKIKPCKHQHGKTEKIGEP